MAITPEQIIETAETLLEQGTNPTLAAVRAELGGGSYTTISEALKGWKEKRQAAQARAEVVQVPPAVQEAMANAAVTVWTQAQQQHAAALAAEREALDTERQRLEAERLEAVELADQVSRDLDQVRATLEKTEKALGASTDEAATLRADLEGAKAEARERATRIESLEVDASAAKDAALNAAGREERLSAELETAQQQADIAAGELAAEREARAQAENEARELGGQVERSAGELERVKVDLEKAYQERDQAIDRFHQAEERAIRVGVEREAAMSERDEARESAAVREASEREAVEAAAELRGRLTVHRGVPGPGRRDTADAAAAWIAAVAKDHLAE